MEGKMEEQKVAVDFSEQRDAELQELNDALPILTTSDYLRAKVILNKNNLRPIDSYLNYNGDRVLGSTEVVDRLDVAAAIILNPLAVWRDFLKKNDSSETTALEYYFGFFEEAKRVVFGLVTVRRNVLIDLKLNPNALKILEKINGLQTFKAF